MSPQSTRVPRVYIDTSVANVYLFGQAIEVERYLSTEHLFRFLDSRVADGLISQIWHVFCLTYIYPHSET
jgi:hypothetical protein